MPVETKLEPLDQWVKLAVSETLSPIAQKKAVAQFARGALQDAQQQNQRILGRVPPHTTYVNGHEGGTLESVNVGAGSIVFEFEIVTDVMIWIGNRLRERSPVASGRYRDAHTLFADGKEVPAGGQIPQASEYVFTNLLPYSRKIEIGKTRDGRKFVLHVDDMVYERTSNEARRRFGNIAKIAFTYRGLIGLSSGSGTLVNPARDPTRSRVSRGAGGRFASSASGAKAYNKSSVRFPAIVITPN